MVLHTSTRTAKAKHKHSMKRTLGFGLGPFGIFGAHENDPLLQGERGRGGIIGG